MIRTFTAILYAAAVTTSAAWACAGPDPAIAQVRVENVQSNGGQNTYHIVGTVTNEGSAGQPANTVQFVDVYVDNVKKDSLSIPPLHIAQYHTFRYKWSRSADAGKGTTTVRFEMNMVHGKDCDPANGVNSVTF
jgi:hypothetical protein